MLIKKHNKKISKMKKSIIVVFSGNILSQIILFGTTPILTRLYSPEDFGVLASYTSLISILLAISILSFEKVIPLVNNERTAINIVILSSSILSAFSISAYFLLLVYGESILAFFNMTELINYYWFIPVSLFVAGHYIIFNYYAIRSNSFKDISISKVSQSVSQILTQIFMAIIFSSSTLWLIIGDGIGRSAGVLRLFKSFKKVNKRINKKVLKKKIILLGFLKYRSFSIQATFSSFLSTLTMQMPILLIGLLYDPYFAGLYLLSQKVIGLPITLITRSISQVYYSEAIKLLRVSPKKLSVFFKKSVFKLFSFSFVPLTLIGIVAPLMITYFLGVKWEESGQYIQYLIPMFIAQLSITPLGQTLYVTKSTGLHLFWEVFRLFVLSTGMFIAYFYDNNNIDYLIISISLSMTVSYFVYFFIAIFNLKKLSE